MIDFVFPDSRAFLPFFLYKFPHASHFAQMGSHFAQNTTTNPCSLLSRHKPLSGICTYTKHPRSHLKTSCGQNELPSRPNGPQLGKMFKIGQTFQEVGKFLLFMDTCLRKNERKIRNDIHYRSFSDRACILASLQCSVQTSAKPLAKLLPPPELHCSVRRPGEEVHERFGNIL